MTNAAEETLEQNGYEFYEVSDVDDVPPGERIYLELDDKPVIIFNVDGEFFAIDDECTHDNGPLGEGQLENHHIICPRHGARFDIRNGRVLALPAVKDVGAYPVRVRYGKIEIGIKIGG
ncbi:MAG: non-heme iron oxygenase ferredoxin subunit [Anaerolineaceae bacterium]